MSIEFFDTAGAAVGPLGEWQYVGLVASDGTRATVHAHGACATSFELPHGRQLFFLSPDNTFTPDRPIRGGIPICFPWFGKRADAPELPQHGFARLRRWQLAEFQPEPTALEDGVSLTLRLVSDAETKALWPYEFEALYRVVVRSHLLDASLVVKNMGMEPFKFEAALHTYFAVPEAAKTLVHGLDGADYLDKNLDYALSVQSGPVEFSGAVDRVYLGTSADCELEWDGRRRVHHSKRGSEATVVWNPGPHSAHPAPPFVCVEAAACNVHAITLQPGEQHELAAVITPIVAG